MRLRRSPFVLTALLIVLTIAAFSCGGGSNKGSTPTPPRSQATQAQATATKGATAQPTQSSTAAAITSPAAPTKVDVEIVDFSFKPQEVTVAVGGTVTWTNNGSASHTATANDGSFDSGTLTSGKSFSFTFSTAGSFDYICSIHPFMKGTVKVVAP
jgi:plastocyanin